MSKKKQTPNEVEFSEELADSEDKEAAARMKSANERAKKSKRKER